MGIERASGLSGELLVTQSNQLVESAHSMSLNEKRLIFAAISMHDSRKPLQEKGAVLISATEFGEVFGFQSRGHAYEALEQASRQLYNRSIRTIEKGPKGPRERNVRWVWLCEYQKKQGAVMLGFSPGVLPYLTQLHEQFTTFQLRMVGGLSTFYSMRIYELCSQFRKTQQRRITLDRFREVMDLGEKYQDVKNLRMRVIDPSIAEINAQTDLTVSYEPLRKGRKITGLQFTIEIDDQRRLPLKPPGEEDRAAA